MDEYKILREEQMDKLKTQERLTQLCYTIVLAIWTAAFTIENEWVLLFALLIIVPISVRVLKSRMDSAFLAAYMAICLEPKLNINWETNNAKYCNTYYRDKELTNFHVLTQLEFVFLSTITSVLFWMMRGGNLVILNNHIIAIIVILLQLTIVIFELIIVRQFYKYKEHRNEYMRRWKKVLCNKKVHLKHK